MDFGLVEFYTIPIFFLIGLISNVSGSMCLLLKSKLRQQCSFFMLAVCGLVDCLLLFTQLQRWLAIHFDPNLFLNNHSMCKLYFWLVKFSILFSFILLFFLTLRSFLFIFNQKYKLSVSTGLGQMVSNLAVVYSFSLSISFSMYELWTSGLKDQTGPIFDEEYSREYFNETRHLTGTGNCSCDLKCSKNVHSILVIDYLNILFFLILFALILSIMIMSLLIIFKLKRIKMFKVFVDFFNSTNEMFIFEREAYNHNNQHEKLNSETSFTNLNDLDRTEAPKTTCNTPYELGLVNRATRVTAYHLPSFAKKTQTKMASYLCILSFLSASICLPFIFYDLLALKIIYVDIKRDHFYERILMLIINVPFMAKFLILFLLSNEYRRHLSSLLRWKSYFRILSKSSKINYQIKTTTSNRLDNSKNKLINRGVDDKGAFYDEQNQLNKYEYQNKNGLAENEVDKDDPSNKDIFFQNTKRLNKNEKKICKLNLPNKNTQICIRV